LWGGGWGTKLSSAQRRGGIRKDGSGKEAGGSVLQSDLGRPAPFGGQNGTKIVRKRAFCCARESEDAKNEKENAQEKAKAWTSSMNSKASHNSVAYEQGLDGKILCPVWDHRHRNFPAVTVGEKGGTARGEKKTGGGREKIGLFSEARGSYKLTRQAQAASPETIPEPKKVKGKEKKKTQFRQAHRSHRKET